MFNKVNKSTEVIYKEEALPSIFITKGALNKMQVYIEECSKEIGWLGTVEKHGSAFIINDVMLFEQEISATTTDIDETDLNNFARNTLLSLGNEEGVKQLNSVKVWGHSHVNMTVFASGTDNESMNMFEESGHDYFIRIIGNKKGDLKVDLYDYDNGIEYQNLPFYTILSDEEESILEQMDSLQDRLDILRENEIVSIEESIKAEMKLKLKEKVYGVTKVGATKTQYPKVVDNGYYGRYDYQQPNFYDERIYMLEGIEVSENEIFELATALNEDECREMLIEWGLYTNQTPIDLMNIIIGADDMISKDLA